MAGTLTVAVLTAACLFAFLMLIAVGERFRSRMLGVMALAVGLSGVALYSYGYTWLYGPGPLAVVRAFFSCCRLFCGAGDLDAVKGAPLLSEPAVQLLYWATLFLAFSITVSAAISAVGSRLLQWLRVTRLRGGDLLLVYGTGADAAAYGRCMAERKRAELFVDPDCSQAREYAVRGFGAVVDRSRDAAESSRRFLRRIAVGPGRGRLEAAALHEDGGRNLRWAEGLGRALREAGVRPEQAGLLISGIGEEEAGRLQAVRGGGFGSVWAFDPYELTARMLFLSHPPCGAVDFDENGRARQDLHAVIVGFGRMGRAALKGLVMNGQFEGSAFRADVFDPDAQIGSLYGHELLRRYDVRFHADAGASEAFCAFLAEHGARVRLILLCTGDRDKNRELAEDLRAWFAPGAAPVVLQAERGSFAWRDEESGRLRIRNVYEDSGLDPSELDAAAMAIHARYCGADAASARAEWSRCDYFSRLSSRASADFYPAVLRASGRTAEQVIAGDWPPRGELLENLARTEHLRWCAFHVVMGYRAMSPEAFEARAEQYRREAERGAPAIRIAKDAEGRRHACLVPWEELPGLSRRENAVTGGCRDYQQLDRENVLALRDVLTAAGRAEGAADG